MAPKIHFPKHIYVRQPDGTCKAQEVKTPEALEALDVDKWAESPADFDEDGVAIHREEVDLPDEVVPGVTPNTEAWPKWLYHRDGKNARVFTQDEADRLIDKADWFESPELTENFQANKAVHETERPAGESLWETKVSDVLEMLKGASLEVLERTYEMENQNPGRPRKNLLRELGVMIEAAQEQKRKDEEAAAS